MENEEIFEKNEELEVNTDETESQEVAESAVSEEAIDAVQSDTSNGNLTTTNNISCNDIMTRTGWAADRLSHGQTAYSNLMSGRISFKWVQNSSGVWRIYVYVDGALVRDW